jgi:Mycothiol maleylpyruvate isomerase N-terminal domain
VGSHSGALDAPFLTASASSLHLLGLPEVAARWAAESVLPKMSVGALACHLGRQVARAAELLAEESELPALVSAEEHYRRAAWVTSTSPDDPANDRSLDDEEALLGPTALLSRTASALESVRSLLADGGARDVVPVPWQGWSLSRADFLLTRLVETVVHADDLAVSVGVPTPEFPEDVFGPVRDLLIRLAVRRHGQSAVIGALARAERTRVISAF